MKIHYKKTIAVLCLALLISNLPFAVKNTNAQVRPVYDYGALGLGQLLRRLQTTASVMHTGAHPDDEDTALIARLARGDNARVVYFSLNRGEGGQNIIGPELFDPLGVIRTEELLQSRRLDGGSQLFASTYDYGYSKTLKEAKEKWDEKKALGDMVRAIRTFRPLVIVSGFSGTPSDGHGQHQFAGYLTPIAFKAAADPAQFPEQLKEGLRPWQARKLYVRQNNQPTLTIQTGQYDPLLGRTYFEIAMESRSQHKSQQMGLIEARGTQTSGERLVERIGITGDDKNIFDGLDVSIKGIANLSGLKEGLIDNELGQIQKAAEKALAEYDPFNPEKIIPHLVEGKKAITKSQYKLWLTDQPQNIQSDKYKEDYNFLYATFLLNQKSREFSQALQLASGVVVDALTDMETIAPNESTIVSVRVFAPNRSASLVTNPPATAGGTDISIVSIKLKTPNGWKVEEIQEPTSTTTNFRGRRENAQKAAYFRLTVPESEKSTQPYWLEKSRTGSMFDWSDDAPKNEPFADSLITAEVKLNIGGVEITATKDAQYRYADDIRGEIRRELNVVPALSVSLDSKLIISPVSAKPQTHRVAVRVTNNSMTAKNGAVSLRLPNGWKSEPASVPISFTKKGERGAAIFNVTVPANAKSDAYKIAAQIVADGKTYDQEMHTLSYQHIQTHRYYTNAETTFRVFDLKVSQVRVGYIMGSGDGVADAIKQMGLNVTMLGEEDLSSGDLSRFDTIVVGIRASEVRADFVANNSRLLEFVKNGGTLIVQYQLADYVRLNLAPYPAQMSARVADENAKVTILEPTHPAFNFPNKITEEDFNNWVQDRTVSQFTTFDSKYTPLLESHDEGEGEQKGGEVYAEIGKGKYVYTAYAWFRQLPQGVPGAYRLFANLLSLPKPTTPKRK